MQTIIKTIYQDGVFKPLGKVKFPENTKVELAPLINYSLNFSLASGPKELLEMFKYAKEAYQKSKTKLPDGLTFQRKIRKESDRKIDLEPKELNV